MWHYIHECTLWYVCHGTFFTWIFRQITCSCDTGMQTYFWCCHLLFVAFLNVFILYLLTLHSLLLCVCWCRITKVVDKSKKISDVPQWFEGCHLNYAENLLRHRDDRVAIYGLREYICSQSVLWSLKIADAFVTVPNRFECRYSAGRFWCIFGSMLVCFCIVR